MKPFRITAVATLASSLVLAGCTSSQAGQTASSAGGSTRVAVSTSAVTTTPPTSPTTPTSVAGSSPASSGVVGSWHGTWTSAKFQATSGEFTVTFTQQGSTITGSIDIHPSCIPHGTVTGHVTGSTISFGQVQGSQRAVSFTGQIAGSSMSGSYSSDPACGNDRGTWKATRI